jgi:signal transduction histidine kinase
MPTEESYPQLISLAVHELRTPASVVGGYLRMLLRDGDTPLGERHHKMISEAEKSCARLVALIAELSDVAKFDDGRIALATRPIDLFSLVAEVAASVHQRAEHEVHLQVRGDNGGADMVGDEPRLRAAFDAIFTAILRERPGPCTVVAERRRMSKGSDTSAVVVVTDEASVQAAYDASPTAFDEKRGGVGLSLPMARRVIEAHGGRLWSPALPDPRAARSAAIIALPLRS